MSRSPGADLEARGRALHFEGDYAGAADAYERAYLAYREEGDPLAAARAARTAGWFHGSIFGDWALCNGWSGRARTLLEQAASSAVPDGWVLLDAARAGRDLATQRRQYLTVVELAQECGDSDLECEARASLGIMLVFSGLVEEGMGHLDQALASLCAGEVEELSVLEGCLCGLFYACERTRDVDRAEQWLRAADGLITRRRLVAVAGYCRAHYAGILIAAGRWQEAEAELTTAMRVLPGGPAVRDTVLCRLAELRLRQGRVEEAAQLLGAVEHHVDALRPLAALHLAGGDAELALETVEQALASSTSEDQVTAPLMALGVDAHLALGDVAAAAALSEQLDELASSASSPYVTATAAFASARVRRVRGDAGARRCLQRAVTLFGAARMPYELACARLELAAALAETRPRVAVVEATASLAAFRGLGASRGADAAAALLRSLGARPPGGPRSQPGLTRREREVLDLLSRGLTNGEIAERLYISPRTVEHHVGHILSKLGLRSRAQAAVHALRLEK